MFSFSFFVILCVCGFTSSNGMTCEEPPKDCFGNKITFYLYTSKDKQVELNLNDTANLQLNLQLLQKNAPTKVIIHGYTGSVNNPLMRELRNAYFSSNEKINIIGVNFEGLAKSPCYVHSTFPSKKIIGKCSAKLMKFISKYRSDVNVKSFHIIGFSIGAHIAAQISNNLDFKLERITGLDPAWPLFFPLFTSNMDRINKKHADLVDIIHTNAGFRGIFSTDAHYDFYANGGRNQPGCDDTLCSHTRSVKYFIESINEEHRFWATKCSVWKLMLGFCKESKSNAVLVGEFTRKPEDISKEGIYVFSTASHVPFSKEFLATNNI